MDKENIKIIACIPVYNEENTIADIIKMVEKHVDFVVLCDDGSNDRSLQIINTMSDHVVIHDENKGKGMALKSAFLYATEYEPDIIVTLDADGQHNPDDIPNLLSPILNKNADVIIGERFSLLSQKNIPLYRKIGLSLINILSKYSGITNVNDTQSGFRAFNKKAYSIMMNGIESGYGVELEQLMLATKNNLRIVEVPISIKYHGLAKTSHKNPLLLGIEILRTLLMFVIQERPLFYLGMPGGFISIIAMIIGGAYLYNFLLYGFSSFFFIMLIFSMFLFGIILIVSSLILQSLILKNNSQKKK